MKYSIASVAPTIAKSFGVELPEKSEDRPINSVLDLIKKNSLEKIQKCLMYAPDAVGLVQKKKFPSFFKEIESRTDIKQKLSSVLPPKTPVCFASMLTGLKPEIHGIRKYEKPVLRIDTIFDVLIRSGIKPAIVAVKNSSVDLMFRERKMEYYSERYDTEAVEKTVELIAESDNDFILCYNQEYDDAIHACDPFGPEAENALKNQNQNFMTLLRQVDENWKDYDNLTMYTPDHGCHIDPETGRGNHGDDISEDMEVVHFYRIKRGIRPDKRRLSDKKYQTKNREDLK
ncbi:alkaline phosphatase family protein [candidate division WOR-3 bacterium]|nr:alkaline phosphatase family protein [candidate division WOR-3 bacterium]